ncbi:uncharacterized protein [Mytilus edulis]|uniref:uncharacterized protein isoform X2 n=1 Tax=Mytilus edulis TaxID=6550 RepID=UPI0039EFDAD7
MSNMTGEKSENGLSTQLTEKPVDEKIKRKKSKRCRRRVSQLLHTHIALITVCVLSALDASCVLGQIICDILIMTEKIHNSEVLETDAATTFISACPALNGTDTTKSLTSIVNILKTIDDCNSSPPGHFNDHYSDIHSNTHGLRDAESETKQWNRILTEDTSSFFKRRILSMNTHRQRVNRASAGGDDHDHHEHTLLEELTHVFHLGSMVILSILVVETFTKMFVMGEKFLHHRLEVFDAFVVTVSWCLDIAFYDGIWAKPGTEAATILIFILPWRVIRIVNSFVLVIQEKDLVQLKIVKQQYRRTVKRANEMKIKTDGYRTETRQLQGLCRKYGANETEIQSCAPFGKKRKVSSVFSAMNSFASLAMIGAVSSVPDLHVARDSSDEEEGDIGLDNSELEKKADHILRSVSVDSGVSTAINSPVTFSLSPDPMEDMSNGIVFNFDEAITTKDLKTGIHTKL